MASTGGHRVELGPLPTIEADSLQLRHMLQSLIGNAVEFHQLEVRVYAEERGDGDAEAKLRSGVGEKVYSSSTEPNMDISEAIHTKRAVRKFQDRHLTEQEVRAILNAGRRAQSSKNSQPWQFVAVQDPGTLTKLSELGPYAGHLAGAALGVVILTPPFEQRFSIMFDAGQAAAYMQLAAWEMGIGSCLATIYQPEEARRLLGFPENLWAYIALSFGYPLDPEVISQPPAKGGRKALEDVVHWERW